MLSIQQVPSEILDKIFTELDKPSLFNATLTCREWQNKLTSRLPKLAHLHIELDSSGCNSHISFRNVSDTSTILCQCDKHVVNQRIFLRKIFQIFGDRLSSVVVEDSLFKSEEEMVDDYAIHVILRDCGKDLKKLEFLLVNLSNVKVWTLVVLARFSELKTVYFDSCEFPHVLTESMFIRMLAPSFNSLEVIRITNNKLISDKFAISVAKNCRNLKELNLNGCLNVTALSVIAFCEALALRKEEAKPFEISLLNTSFNAIELSRHLNNPLLKCGPCWKAQPITVNIGYDRNVIILGNLNCNDLIVMIFVE